MICPSCMNKVSALSSRCEHCTETYGTGGLWAANAGGILFLLIFIGILAIVL